MSSAEPFTLEHFRRWAKNLVLDNGRPWVVEPFQAAFLEDVLGGTSTCWLVVPEGNGKTTAVAGLVLYHLAHTEEGNVPIAASSRQQAEILFQQARGFGLRSPFLAAGDWFLFQEGTRRIRCDRMRSRAQIFAADAVTADGVIFTMAIVEELHRHKNLNLHDLWRGKYGKRGGQVVVISTAGEPGSEFETRREQIRQRSDRVVRDGSYLRAESKQLVLHEYALVEGEDPEDLEAVKRCNPFSGITLSTLRDKFHSPDFSMQHWRRFTCNLPTRSDFAAIQEKEWFDAVDDDGIPAGEPIWVGLDLGWKYDTTAVVPLWVRDHEHRVLGQTHVLVPPRDGTFMDPVRVQGALAEIHTRNPVHTIVMDITDAREIAEWAEGELGCDIVPLSQRIPQKVENYKLFTEALRMGWLKHSGDKDLTSHVLNAVARILPGGDQCFARPVRSRESLVEQDRRVIDALDAASMVHAVAAGELRSAGRVQDLLVL